MEGIYRAFKLSQIADREGVSRERINPTRYIRPLGLSYFTVEDLEPFYRDVQGGVSQVEDLVQTVEEDAKGDLSGDFDTPGLAKIKEHSKLLKVARFDVKLVRHAIVKLGGMPGPNLLLLADKLGVTGELTAEDLGSIPRGDFRPHRFLFEGGD